MFVIFSFALIGLVITMVVVLWHSVEKRFELPRSNNVGSVNVLRRSRI